MLHQLARGWGSCATDRRIISIARDLLIQSNSLQIKIIEYVQQELQQMIVDTRLI